MMYTESISEVAIILMSVVFEKAVIFIYSSNYIGAVFDSPDVILK